MDKEYDSKKLLQVYIEAQRQHPAFVEEEHRTYYQRLLAQLETAFGLQISSETSGNRILFHLFQSTALSCRDLRHPWSGYIEATPLVQRLKEQGEVGQRILDTSDEILNLTKASEERHLAMLHDLFECIWGHHETVVTSQQLRDMGFDDSKEPDWLDFV